MSFLLIWNFFSNLWGIFYIFFRWGHLLFFHFFLWSFLCSSYNMSLWLFYVSFSDFIYLNIFLRTINSGFALIFKILCIIIIGINSKFTLFFALCFYSSEVSDFYSYCKYSFGIWWFFLFLIFLSSFTLIEFIDYGYFSFILWGVFFY